MKSTIVIFISIALLSACKKENSDTPLTLSDCHNAMKWDSISFRNHLINKWQLKRQLCNFPYSDDRIVDKIVLNFKNNDTVEITKNSILIEKSAWHLKVLNIDNDKLYLIETDSLIKTFPLWSGTLMCESQLSFDSRADDGCLIKFDKI